MLIVNGLSCKSCVNGSGQHYLIIEVLHGSKNVTSRTGNTPSCRATAGEKCTETVGRMKSGAHCESSALAL